MTSNTGPTSDLEHVAALREWARGMTALSAATELVIRAGFAQKSRPWIHYDEDTRRPWIDFDQIPDLCGAMSGGEQRPLRIAASLSGTTPIVLGDEIVGLDHRWTELMRIAIAHAAGFTEPTTDVVFEGDTPTRITVPPLAVWPDISR